MTRMLALPLALILTAASLALASGFEPDTWTDADIYALILALDLNGDVLHCPPSIAAPDTSCFVAPRDVAWTQIGLERLVTAASGFVWLEEWMHLGGGGVFLRPLLIIGSPEKMLLLAVVPIGHPGPIETLVVVTMLPED